MKKLRLNKKIAGVLLSLCTVCCVSGIALSSHVGKVDAEGKAIDELFQVANVNVETGRANGEKKGVLLSTNKNYASVEFPDQSAEFSLGLGFVPDGEENTIDALAFDFTNPITGRTLSATLQKTVTVKNEESVTTMEVVFEYQSVKAKKTVANLDMAKGAPIVYFDGCTLTFSLEIDGVKTNLCSLTSSGDMRTMFSALFTVEPFEQFDVKMSFASIKEGKTAQLYYYDYNGEKLTGTAVADEVGPAIYGEPALYSGTLGEKYIVTTSGLHTYDVVDGRKTFVGESVVFSPKGEEIPLSEGGFIPTVEGYYTVVYTARDSKNNAGVPVSYSFYASNVSSVVNWDYEVPVYSGSLPQGTSVTLPMAKASSTAAMAASATLTPVVQVKKDGNVVFEGNATKNNEYTFTEVGEYAVCYSVQNYNGLIEEESFFVMVTAGAEIVRDEVQSSYRLHEYFYLPSATQGGEQLSVKVLSPSGGVTNYPKIALNETGVWTVVYEKSGNRIFEEYFDVFATASDMWETENGVKFDENGCTPAYFDFSSNGLLATATVGSGEMFFANPIDLASKTKEDTLVEFVATPSDVGVSELKLLAFVIRDAYNPENYIELTFQPNIWGYTSLTDVELTLSSGQSIGGKQLNTSMCGKFMGGKVSTDPIIYGASMTNLIAIGWDDEEKAIYLSPERGTREWYKFADLDNSETFGAGNEWQGFSSSEVEVGFVFKKIAKETSILITSFDGVSYTQSKLEDDIAPSIVLEGEQNAVGKVGLNYPCPVAYGLDAFDGKINDVRLEVRYLNGNGFVSVPTSGKFSFLPSKAGVYQLVYSVTDNAGNTGSIIREICVEDELPPIWLEEELWDLYADSFSFASILQLKDIPKFGGSGTLKGQYYLSYNGEKIPVEGNVTLTRAGNCRLIYEVTDYLGQKESYFISIYVHSYKGPVFNNVTVTKYTLAGKAYSVPIFSAIDYSGNSVAAASITYYIDGQEVRRGEKITPTKDFALKVVATDGVGNTTEQVHQIKVLTPRKSTADFSIDHFIINEGVSLSAEQAGVKLTANGKGSVEYFNALPANKFSVGFFSTHEELGEGIFVVRLMDSVRADCFVTLRFKQLGDTLQYCMNDGMWKTLSASMFKTAPFVLSVIGKEVYHTETTYMTSIVNFDNGTMFDGFSGGLVYVSFGLENVTETRSVSVASICNQSFGGILSDKIKPMVVFENEMVRRVDKGEKIILPTVIARDILDSEVSFTVEIQAPDESILYSGNVSDYVPVSAEQYGKYFITYTAKDSSKNTMYVYNSLQVLDYSVPIITITGKIPTGIQIGGTFKIPEASTNDDNTIVVYLITPEGVLVEVQGGQEITASVLGKYRIAYYAYNADTSGKVTFINVIVS